VNATDTDGVGLGRRFVEAIVGHDWDALAACFAADARLTAVVPKENAFRDRVGREAAAGQLKAWFGNADVTELLDSDVESIADRVRIVYRIREHEPDGWYLVEQVAYATVDDGGFSAMNLACSGFRPLPG
jgi:NAD(P)-dependent dehydrogenase (short-subunit alcohol dehydrogenase family)